MLILMVVLLLDQADIDPRRSIGRDFSSHPWVNMINHPNELSSKNQASRMLNCISRNQEGQTLAPHFETSEFARRNPQLDWRSNELCVQEI